MWIPKTNQTNKTKLNTLIDTENKLVITRGVECGKMNEMGEEG